LKYKRNTLFLFFVFNLFLFTWIDNIELANQKVYLNDGLIVDIFGETAPLVPFNILAISFAKMVDNWLTGGKHYQ